MVSAQSPRLVAALIVTPVKRGKKPDSPEPHDNEWHEKSPAERHRAITWMHRLKGVFNIDIKICEHSRGHGKVIACIQDPKVIDQILNHLKQEAAKIDTASFRSGRRSNLHSVSH